MDPFFETIRNATTLKKFLDELEKNPKRTLLALGAVILLTGAGVAVAVRAPSERARPLSELPTAPAKQGQDGQYHELPQPTQAEEKLKSALQADKFQADSVTAELGRRKDNDPVTEREIHQINGSGNVQY